MELIKIISPENDTFEVTKPKLAKLISKGWKLQNPEQVLIKQPPVDTTVIETAEVLPVEIVAEPTPADTETFSASKNEDAIEAAPKKTR